MNVFKWIPRITIVSGLSISLTLQAAESPAGTNSPYFFTGPCASQGSWTQQALSQTQRLRDITNQLKNDSNCKNLSISLQATLDKMDAEFKNATTDNTKTQKLSQLPMEIAALRGFVSESSAMRSQVMNLILNKSIENSAVSAQVDNGGQSASSQQFTPVDAQATNLMSLGQRAQRAASTGMTLFSGVMDSLPQIDQCLASPNDMGPLLGATIKTLASFAASNQDTTGSSLGQLLSKFTSLMREKRYAMVLRTLNQQEFLASTSCLIEVTSETYCTARDGMMLFQKMMDDLKVTKGDKDTLQIRHRLESGRQIDNPMAGYYLLTQQIPIITNWIQKVQIGVDPKLPTDAAFQVKILDEVNNFYKRVKVMQGNFSQRINTIRELSSFEAKQNFALDLITSTTNATGINDDLSQGQINFFTISTVAMEIPFRLIGVPVPARVAGTDGKGPPQEYQSFLQGNYKSMPEFSNPTALVQKVGENLDRLVDNAKQSAIEYYNKWFIVDKIAVVNDSMLGMNYNVKDSLIAIDQYLAGLTERIKKYSNDQTYIASILETRYKIHTVLRAYNRLQKLSEKLASLNGDIDINTRSEIVEVHAEVIKTIYDQFEVLLARSGWLANRMIKFVYYDYTMMLHANVDFSPYHEELFYATGLASVDRMLQMAGGNPANVQSDLSMALRINKGNLEALELLLKDNAVQMISSMDMIARNKKPTAWSVYWNSHERSYKDGLAKMPDENTGVALRTARGLWNSFSSMVIDPLVTGKNDKYPLPDLLTMASGQMGQMSPDDEFGSAQRVKSQLCVQSLAFGDLRSFWNLCQKVELKSPFPAPALTDAEKDKFADYLSVNYAQKAYEDKSNAALNHSKRICAFRDYNRRNLVLYLTMNMRSPKDPQRVETWAVDAEQTSRANQKPPVGLVKPIALKQIPLIADVPTLPSMKPVPNADEEVEQ